MKTRTALLTLLSILLLASTSATADEPANKEEARQAEAMERLAEAKDLWRGKADYTGALAAFNAAVELVPDDIEIRLSRGNFLEVVSRIVVEEDREKFKAFARDDYRFVAEEDPDSLAAGVARDALARLDGRVLFPETHPDCPEDAVRALRDAEALFHRGEYSKSIPLYQTAAASCPASAAIVVSHADAYYMLRDFEKAAEVFRQALEIDPWNRMAHRFLSDTELNLFNGEAALRHAALAVVADPTYEAAWAGVRQIGARFERDWLRVWGDKPIVKRDGEDAEATNITVTIPGLGDEETSDDDVTTLEVAAGDDDEIDPDRVLWMTYAIMKASILGGIDTDAEATGEPSAPDADIASLGPYETEERAVLMTLDGLPEPGEAPDEESGTPPGPFWAMMQRAADAGFLTEAIYLHLMDEDLVDEYRAYRDAHADRLVEYIETMIVPVPEAPEPIEPE